jgi:hypothetical protein
MLLRRCTAPRQVKDYNEQLGEIRSDHDRVCEHYIKLSERLTNKMDELAEAEEEKIRLEYENQKIMKKYLELLKQQEESCLP